MLVKCQVRKITKVYSLLLEHSAFILQFKYILNWKKLHSLGEEDLIHFLKSYMLFLFGECNSVFVISLQIYTVCKYET